MTRPAGWKKELRLYAAARAGTEFEWGYSDCGTIVRDAVAIVTGEDPLGSGYATQAAALRLLRKLGSVPRALEAIGAVRVRDNFAMPGDVLVNPESADHVVELAVMFGRGALGADVERGVYWLAGVPAWDCYRLPGGSSVGVDG